MKFHRRKKISTVLVHLVGFGSVFDLQLRKNNCFLIMQSQKIEFEVKNILQISIFTMENINEIAKF